MLLGKREKELLTRIAMFLNQILSPPVGSQGVSQIAEVRS